MLVELHQLSLNHSDRQRRHTQTFWLLQYPPANPWPMQWAAHRALLPNMSQVIRVSFSMLLLFIALSLFIGDSKLAQPMATIAANNTNFIINCIMTFDFCRLVCTLKLNFFWLYNFYYYPRLYSNFLSGFYYFWFYLTINLAIKLW